MTSRKQLWIGLSLASTAMLAIAFISYQSVTQSAQDREWVLHTHQVLITLGVVRADMLLAETSQRGFILSNDSSYLAAYGKAKINCHQSVSALRELTHDNQTQQNSLDRLESLISQKFGLFDERIDIRRQSGLSAAAESIREGIGRDLMDKIHTVLGQMVDEENRLWAIRKADLEKSSQQTKIAILVGNTVAFLLLASAGWMIWSEFAQRRRAEKEVHLLNLQLEAKVRERTAQLAARTRDLERSNGELEQFAYVASHDLQEPLRMVASFTQLLAKRYADKLDQNARDFITYAVDGATRMQTLITDLLAFSRVGTQGKPLVPTECDAVLDRVLASLKLAVEESEAVIRRDSLPQIMADPVQLEQLFQNLLTNAIKFHGQGAPRIFISASRDGDDWKFAFRDNGIGISPDHADRIFVIFQRLHTKTEYPGTGIGLAIAKKIVERHGGRIWFEPSPGGGSTFYFTVPAIQRNQSIPGEQTHELAVTAPAH